MSLHVVHQECVCVCLPHRDVRLVDIVLAAAFSDEEHAVEQEERPLVLCSMDFEGSLQNQLSVRGQVRTLPVQQQRLNLLRNKPGTRSRRSTSRFMISHDIYIRNKHPFRTSCKKSAV